MLLPIPDTPHRIRHYLDKYRWKLSAGVVCVLFTQMIRQVSPLVAAHFIDSLPVLKKQNWEGLWPLTFICIGIILGTTALRGVFQFLMRHLVIRTSRQIEMELRQTVMQKLQRLTPTYYHAHPTGDLMSRCTADMEAVRNLFGPGILHSANSVFALISVLAGMIYVDAVLTAWVVIPTAVLLTVAYFWMTRLYGLSLEVQNRIAAISSTAQENFTGVGVIKAFRREEHEIKHMDDECNRYVRALLSYALQNGFLRAFMQSFLGMLYVILIWVGGSRIISGEMTTGDMTAFVAYAARLLWPLMAIGWVAGIFQRSQAAMERIQSIFKAAPDVVDPTTPAALEPFRGEIVVDNLRFRYTPDAPEALRGISFTVPAGTQTAIVGATGSGKSTLAKLLMHYYPVAAGAIRYDGVDINNLSVDALRRNVAYVSQEPFLFSDTLTYNIGFSRQDDVEETDIVAAATLADVDKDIRGFPRGYGEVIGERGVTLSGGQKQRTAIARAALKQSPVLLLDDAFSSVDTQTERNILDNLAAEASGCTRVVIAHRVSTVQDSDQILVLDEGEVVERGTHDELLRKGGRYADLHKLERLRKELEV